MKALPRNQRRQLGIALVVVLWFLVLLSILALGFSRGMRSEAQISRNLLEGMRARHLADAAIQRGIYDLLQPLAVDQTDPLLSGQAVVFDMDGAQLSYRLKDEYAKIDINQAVDELIEGLLLSLGVDENKARAVTDAILDWRDENDLRRLNGAEQAEYDEAGLTGRPGNGPFRSIQELRQVWGVDTELYKRLAPFVTVYTFSDKINPRVAPREVLMAVPGIDSTEVDALIQARESVSEDGTTPAIPALTGVESWISEEIGPVYSITGHARLRSGALATRRMVVWFGEMDDENLYYVLDTSPVESWRDDDKEEP